MYGNYDDVCFIDVICLFCKALNFYHTNQNSSPTRTADWSQMRVGRSDQSQEMQGSDSDTRLRLFTGLVTCHEKLQYNTAICIPLYSSRTSLYVYYHTYLSQQTNNYAHVFISKKLNKTSTISLQKSTPQRHLLRTHLNVLLGH